jgi:large subunit ribosomal protein L31e
MAEKKTQEKKSEKLEREYVIPLRRKFKLVPCYKKANKAMKAIKEFLAKHMKVEDRDLNKVKVDKYVNEYIWHRSIKRPPAKVKVKAVKNEDGTVNVTLVKLPEKLKYKKQREEKLEKVSQEIAEQKKLEKQSTQEKAKQALKGVKKSEEDKDKDKDGVEDEKEEKEKQESVETANQENLKEKSKENKDTTKKEPDREAGKKKTSNKAR